MPQVVDRFTVSLDTELLAAFDRHISARGYETRSEAVRDLIRDTLLATQTGGGKGRTCAFLTVVCDHRTGEGMRRLRKCLTDDSEFVRGVLQLPIDEHRDGMAIGLRGTGEQVQMIADRISAIRGVSYGHLSALPDDDRDE